MQPLCGWSSFSPIMVLPSLPGAMFGSFAGVDSVCSANRSRVACSRQVRPKRAKLRQVSCILLSAILELGLAQSACWAKVIHIPGDKSTIQAGINVASNGDTVEVSPGTYDENINFNGKLVRLVSEGGQRVTIIDGNQAGPVVTFSRGESRAALLSGFTIRHGLAAVRGGGINI